MYINSKSIYVGSAFVFAFLAFVLPSDFIPSDLNGTILTVSTFLFGLIAGFYIVVTTTDYNLVKNILATETGALIALYNNVLIYNRDAAQKLAEEIDTYLIEAFDYEIIDYSRASQNTFRRITTLVEDLPLEADRSYLHEVAIGILYNITMLRQQLLALGTKSLSFLSWVVLFTLGGIVTVSIYSIRGNSIFLDVIAVLVSSTLVLILLLIRELDLYIWNEHTFGFEIFQRVFESIGKLPYYPSYSLKKGRIVPKESEYRVGVYQNYPVTLEKTIEVRKVLRKPLNVMEK
jgi:hypothetical protein